MARVQGCGVEERPNGPPKANTVCVSEQGFAVKIRFRGGLKTLRLLQFASHLLCRFLGPSVDSVSPFHPENRVLNSGRNRKNSGQGVGFRGFRV